MSEVWGGKMKRASFVLGTTLLFFALSSVDVWAQATAQISGSVRDQSGAVLPGAEVTATQTETGIARTAVSNETGSYVLPNLAIGPYKLEVATTFWRQRSAGETISLSRTPSGTPISLTRTL